MEPIKITFLGTSNAIPSEKRNHPAILLSYKNENILIDCGEGTQRQMRIAKFSPAKLTRILITHWHGDHTLGLLGLIETLIMTNYSKTLYIYGPKGTKYYFDILSQFLGPYKTQQKLNIKIEEVHGTFFETGDFYLQSAEMSHGIPSNSYAFVIKDKRRLLKEKIKKLKLPNSPLLGQLQQGKTVMFNNRKISPNTISKIEKGRKITFIMDTLPNQNIFKIARNSDLIVCESTFSENDKALAVEKKHLTSKEAATIAKKAGAKKLFLTHISERYEKNPLPILQEAKKVFKNSFLAKDFDVVEI